MEQKVIDLKSIVDALDKELLPCLPNDIRTGFSINHLHDFIKSQPDEVLDRVHKITRKLIKADDGDVQTDLFLEIYDRISCKIPVHSTSDLLFLVELICILALLQCRMPDPPIILLRPLLNAIPEELRTIELISDIADKVVSISSDIGDMTHLCMLFALLGHSWNTLIELICWLTLKRVIKCDDAQKTKPSIPELHNLMSTKSTPNTTKVLAMTLNLIGMLINRLALKEFGKNVQESLIWLKHWLTTLPNNFNALFVDMSPKILDVMMLESQISELTTYWPVIVENNEKE